MKIYDDKGVKGREEAVKGRVEGVKGREEGGSSGLPSLNTAGKMTTEGCSRGSGTRNRSEEQA